MAYTIMDFHGYASTPAYALRAALDKVRKELRGRSWEVTSLSHSTTSNPKAKLDEQVQAQVVLVLQCVIRPGKKGTKNTTVEDLSNAALQIEEYQERERRKKKKG